MTLVKFNYVNKKQVKRKKEKSADNLREVPMASLAPGPSHMYLTSLLRCHICQLKIITESSLRVAVKLAEAEE